MSTHVLLVKKFPAGGSNTVYGVITISNITTNAPKIAFRCMLEKSLFAGFDKGAILLNGNYNAKEKKVTPYGGWAKLTTLTNPVSKSQMSPMIVAALYENTSQVVTAYAGYYLPIIPDNYQGDGTDIQIRPFRIARQELYQRCKAVRDIYAGADDKNRRSLIQNMIFREADGSMSLASYEGQEIPRLPEPVQSTQKPTASAQSTQTAQKPAASAQKPVQKPAQATAPATASTSTTVTTGTDKTEDFRFVERGKPANPEAYKKMLAFAKQYGVPTDKIDSPALTPEQQKLLTVSAANGIPIEYLNNPALPEDNQEMLGFLIRGEGSGDQYFPLTDTRLSVEEIKEGANALRNGVTPEEFDQLISNGGGAENIYIASEEAHLRGKKPGDITLTDSLFIGSPDASVREFLNFIGCPYSDEELYGRSRDAEPDGGDDAEWSDAEGEV